jgi:hypothetical protein
MSDIIKMIREVGAEIGQVRKDARVKLARLRALKDKADRMGDVKQSASLAREILKMTAQEAKTIKQTVDMQEKAYKACADIAEKGVKMTNIGKNVYKLAVCDKMGAELGEGMTLSVSDGRAAWDVLSGVKGFLMPEQIELLDERTGGAFSGMEPGDVFKLKKVGENNEWEKLVRCGGIAPTEDEEDGRYWEVIKPADVRTIPAEFIRRSETANA